MEEYKTSTQITEAISLCVLKGRFFMEVKVQLNEIFTFENLYKAHQKCRKGKQHRQEVIRFEMQLGINLIQIMEEIQNGKFHLGPYKTFNIYEPKERLIEALPYRNRVVIQCFCTNCLPPRIERHVIYDNAACREGKGTSFAKNRLHLFLRKAYAKKYDNCFYYLKCDISKYFASIQHGILLEKLRKIGFSLEEMQFLEILVKEQPQLKQKGLALGNLSSQWFALLYLDRVDRLIKEELRIKYYVRYMDDMILLSRDKKELQNCKQRIEEVCKEELKLLLNSKTQIGRVEDGIDFLGMRHILTENGKIICKLRMSSKVRLKRHLANLEKLKNEGIVDERFVNQRKNAFSAHLKETNESRSLKAKVKVE